MNKLHVLVFPLASVIGFASLSVFVEWIFNAHPGPEWLYHVASDGVTIIPHAIFGMLVLLLWLASLSAFLASLVAVFVFVFAGILQIHQN